MYKEFICLIVFVSLSHSAQVINNRRTRQATCTLPPYPEHGTYTSNVPKGKPGDVYDYIEVSVTCDQNYGLQGNQSVYCYNGWWIEPVAKCVLVQQGDPNSAKRCVLPSHPSHGRYHTNLVDGRPGQAYNFMELNITCDQNYIVEGVHPIHCYDGWWSDSQPKCIALPNALQVQPSGGVFDRVKGKCTLPPLPDHGTYVTNVPNPKPGNVYDYFNINVTCDTGYKVQGTSNLLCYDGWWPDRMPQCVVSSVAPPNGGTGNNGQGNTCVLPDYPNRGTYYSTNVNGARPGEAYDFVAINVTCQDGYVVNRKPLVFCTSGEWSSSMPQCVSRCRLKTHPSVEYRCRVPAEWAEEEKFRKCNTYEPAGTLVKPVCRPLYQASNLVYMECRDGEWSNYVPKCSPQCGILAAKPPQLISNASLAKYGEVPWHSSIYRKTSRPYDLICGGSLISANRVISAAHCFWDDFTIGPHPASEYVVAFGKFHRDFDSKLDKSQSSNVEAIRISPYFKGSTTNFQSDIAVLELTTNIDFRTHIRPVCVDYDRDFEERQLQPGNTGKVAGWGLTTREGQPADELRVVDLPFVPIKTCFDTLPQTFSMFVTSDKICAGYDNAGTAVCKGDSGGGLAFSTLDKGVPKYYLRGVVSTAPTNDDACNTDTYTTFTRLITHEEFIKLYGRD